MATNGGEEDFLDMWSDIDFSSLEQLLRAEDFPMAKPSNGGYDLLGVSGAQGNNAQAPDQRGAQTAVATPHAQGDSNGTLDSLTMLNLESHKTLYMLKKTEAILSEGQVDRRTCEALGFQKFKATTEPFSVLKIGNYEVRPRYPSHLVAKWSYSKKWLNWEILEHGLKKKIEISWMDISAIRVEYGGNVEILEIEV
ncbi:hypothetical protein NL676_030511 [Syzygium grande]|nr:hypothetical protein NL676_030511 [Syzygium grande]